MNGQLASLTTGSRSSAEKRETEEGKNILLPFYGRHRREVLTRPGDVKEPRVFDYEAHETSVDDPAQPGADHRHSNRAKKKAMSYEPFLVAIAVLLFLVVGITGVALSLAPRISQVARLSTR